MPEPFRVLVWVCFLFPDTYLKARPQCKHLCQCLDLLSGLEIDRLSGVGIENCLISRAIGLQFVSWWLTMFY